MSWLPCNMLWLSLCVSLSSLSAWMSRWISSMPNLQMISPINLQSADVVNLFYSSNLLLSQLLEVGKGNFLSVRACVCVFVHLCTTYALSMRTYVGVCSCTCVFVCVQCGVRAKEQVEHKVWHAQRAKPVTSLWTAATTGRDQTAALCQTLHSQCVFVCVPQVWIEVKWWRRHSDHSGKNTIPVPLASHSVTSLALLTGSSLVPFPVSK